MSKINKLVKPNSEASSDFLHISECDVFLRTLEHADIGTMNACTRTKLFLGQPFVQPHLPKALSKLVKYFSRYTHTQRVGGCLLWVYIL